MAACDPKSIEIEEEEVEYYTEEDDSDEDPTYEFIEETRSSMSNLSIKKPKSRLSKKADVVNDDDNDGDDDDAEISEVKVPELNEKDAKSFDEIEKIIQVGQLEKLKVEQCKIYLRKYGLRLTGKKEILMERIREHLEIVDGRGEKKYPVSSFVMNCKGDACTGDVVMFEQNVYDMYSIVSRSATAPTLGTRVVAGRIVKESYGAAKQQHTFTIEVLWSTGEKPFLPLHPLLIKGRNLYRLKTMRQKWGSEEERRKVLLEKHSRGSLARCSRDARNQAKESRKMLAGKRPKKDTTTTTITTHNQENRNQLQIPVMHAPPPTTHNQENRNQLQIPVMHAPPNLMHPYYTPQPLQHHIPIIHPKNPQPLLHQNYNHPISPRGNFHFPVQSQPAVSGAHRQPFRNLNSASWPLDRPPQMHPVVAQGKRREPCRFYPKGKCYYGDSCKYIHN